MTFIRVWYDQFARAHSEATRAALAYQRKQAGAAPAKTRTGRPASTAAMLDRLLDLWRDRQSAG